MYKIEKYFDELYRRTFLFVFSFLFTLGFLYSWSFEFFLFLFDFLVENGKRSGDQMNSDFRDALQLQSFIFTDMTEAFHTFLGISFTGTLCLQIPYVIYTIWSFLVPSFVNSERQIFTFFTFLFLGIYILSLILTVLYIFPKVLEFFLTFQLENAEMTLSCEPKISSFTSFFWKTFFLTQGICQIPFWIFIGFYYQYIQISFFFHHRRVFYFLLLAFSALIAPPHVVIQFSFSFVMIIFFEVTLFCALLFQNYHHQFHIFSQNQ